MLADIFLVVLVLGAAMMAIGIVEAIRTSGRSGWFIPVLVGLVVAILGVVLRSAAI